MTTSISNASPALGAWWHPVGRVGDFAADPVRVLLLGEPWVVARLDGGISAFRDRCPHRGARLSAGSVRHAPAGPARLQCAYHGWCFDAAGDCVAIPSSAGAPGRGPAFRLRAAAGVCEAYGLVWLAPEPPRDPVLECPEWEEEGFTFECLRVVRMATGAAQMVENNLDTSHIPFVHRATFGTAMDVPDPRSVEISRQGWRLGVRHSVSLGDGHWEASEVAPHEAVVAAPFTSSLRVEFPSGMVNVWYQTMQPEERGSTVVYQFFATNRTDDPRAYQEELAFNQRILDEDLHILSQLDDPALDLDLRAGAHAPADRVTLAYRRMLGDLVADGTPAGARPMAREMSRTP